MNWKRPLLAYGTAAVIIALIVGMLTMNPYATLIALFVVGAFELIVLYPLYILLNSRFRITRNKVLAIGFIIGAAPIGWFLWPLRFPQLRATSSQDGVATMVDGVPTLAGWLDYAQITGLFGAIGLLAAYGFWATLRKRSADVDAAPPGTSRRPEKSVRLVRWQSAVVIAVIAVIVALPAITKDRSCHNVFRDVPTYTGFLYGPHSARPKVNFYFPATKDEWRDVSRFLSTYGRSRNLSVLDKTEEHEGSKQLYVSLCNEEGTVIEILDSIYFFGPPMRQRSEQSISIFATQPNSDWKEQATSLESALRDKYGANLRREDVPMVTASELSQRLRGTLRAPRFSVDEVVDPENLADSCRGKRLDVQSTTAQTDKGFFEFVVSCETPHHEFGARTHVTTHERVMFITQPSARPPGR